jgi:hypothetical protein
MRILSESCRLIRAQAPAEMPAGRNTAKIAISPGRGVALRREPFAMLEQIRRTIGEYNFAGQYQQTPSPLDGGLVKPAWFRHYATAELPSFDRIVQSWDTANKATGLNNFSVCTSWGIKGKDLFLLDVLRRRLEHPERKRSVHEQHERFRPSVVLIEEGGSSGPPPRPTRRLARPAVFRDPPRHGRRRHGRNDGSRGRAAVAGRMGADGGWRSAVNNMRRFSEIPAGD